YNKGDCEMGNFLDLTRIFSTFANQWSMENQGCAGTLSYLIDDPSVQEFSVSGNFVATYDPPVEQVKTNSLSSFSFQNSSKDFKDQQILINTTTPIAESWELTSCVCPGGNAFGHVISPPITDIPGMPIGDSVALDHDEKITHSHSYTWDVDQTIQLPPRSSTKVTFQTQLKHVTQTFTVTYWMTGNIGVISMHPINGNVENYFPITQVLQWYKSDQFTLDMEMNKVTAFSTGIYTATYQIQPQLLVQTTNLDNSTIVEEYVIDINTGTAAPVSKPNGCC
uniref:hypothetical protein n=1 Tax=Bacillus thuringiensis TaxID=1428 RepID=UPI001C92E09C